MVKLAVAGGAADVGGESLCWLDSVRAAGLVVVGSERAMFGLVGARA